MSTKDPDRSPIEEPLAQLERQLISTYVAGAGYDLQTLLARDDEEARTILAAAPRHASETLSEIEARAHYLRKLHGHE